MSCKEFLRALEDHWDRHSAAERPVLTGELASHAEGCSRCAERVRTGLQSRQLLFSLREERPVDPFFVVRVRQRIASEAGAGSAWRRWRVQWRDLLVAGAIFVITLTSFVYDVHRTETPDISEAEVLDVPHVNWQHPADDHTAGATDVFLSLLNP